MALRKIIKMPNSFLRKKASAVDTINNDIKHILDDMLETMYDANGIGLAAIQVGVPKRIILFKHVLKNSLIPVLSITGPMVTLTSVQIS